MTYPVPDFFITTLDPIAPRVREYPWPSYPEITCDHCLNRASSATAVRTLWGTRVCYDCRRAHYWQCSGCDGWNRNGEDCEGDCNSEPTVTCRRCDEQVDEDDTITTLRGSVVCGDCQRDYYWQCSRCNGWNRDGYDCYTGCDDNGCHCGCDDCGGCGDVLREYSYKPDPVFRGDGPLFLGPEIEVEVGDGYGLGGAASYAAEMLGSLGYLKEDSSLSHGFEVVTHPMSLDWAMENFPWEVLPGLAERGARAERSTGMHVHVSRAGFTSPCHRYRWMKFIYRNRDEIQAVARRHDSEYSSFDSYVRSEVRKHIKDDRRHYGQRYSAINPNNATTYELRMFKSSLDPEEVQAAFGFAHASVEYTRGLTYHSIAKENGWTFDAFARWVAERPKYAPLTNQINKLVPTTTLNPQELSVCVF